MSNRVYDYSINCSDPLTPIVLKNRYVCRESIGGTYVSEYQFYIVRCYAFIHHVI